MNYYNYVKLVYKYEIDDWPIIQLSELDGQRFEIRTINIYSNGKYGYANVCMECNAFLSDCVFPTVNDYYNSGEYDVDEADCYIITKEEFESEWKKAVDYCKSNNIIPHRIE